MLTRAITIINKNWITSSFIITVLLWALSVSGRLIKSGFVYGLNFELFQPDGGNYLKLTQDLSTFNIQNSTVYSWTRPLYPVLSIPFYKLLGVNGMLVIPALSLLAVGIIFYYLGESKLDKTILLSCFFILTSSTTVLRWVIADLTDGLHLALFSLCCLGLFRKWNFKTMLFIIILGALARPMGPIWTALFIPFIFVETGKKKLKLTVLAITPSLLFVLNTIVMAIYGGFAPSPKSLTQQIMDFPTNFIKLIFVEFGQIAVLDRVLFYFTILTFILAKLITQNSWARVHLCVTIASFFISAWIGVVGVNFRYQLPLLISGSCVTFIFVKNRINSMPRWIK